METVAWVLLTVGGLVSLIGWILLLIAAFREGVGWGLAILFLSWVLLIPVIVFAVKFWPRAKPGIAAIGAGLVLSCVGWFVVFGAVAGEIASQLERDQLAGVDAGVPAGPPSSGAPGEVVVIEPTAVPTASVLPSPVPEEPVARPTLGVAPVPAEAREIQERNRRLRDQEWGRQIEWSEVASYIGQTVEIHKTSGGDSFKASLVAVDATSVSVSQRMGGGGSVNFSLPRSAISQIRVEN